MRILVYTGKGGVGKTGIAAATAVKSASLGYRTMVMSTDQAHSLADCFERRIGALPVRIADNTVLDALEVDPAVESERTWGSLKGYLRQIIEEKSGSGRSGSGTDCGFNIRGLKALRLFRKTVHGKRRSPF